MSAEIPEHMKDLLERPIVVTLATIMSDNSPQATPVWFSWDGEYIWINTARGRAKDRNMTHHSKVSVLSIDPNDHYRCLEVRGEVAEITEQGAAEHIEFLSQRYDGKPYFSGKNLEARKLQTRVIYKIKPLRVFAHG